MPGKQSEKTFRLASNPAKIDKESKGKGKDGKEWKGRKERNALEIYSLIQGNIPNKRLIPFALLAGIACQVPC
jgi:hypothetical protein